MDRREEQFTLIEQARLAPKVALKICEYLEQDRKGFFGIPVELAQKLENIILTGCGDSWMTSFAAVPAFREIARLNTQAPKCIELSQLQGLGNPDKTMMVGASISGGVVRTREALVRAREKGLHTAVVTNNPNSATAGAVNYVCQIRLPRGLLHGYGLHSYTCSVAVYYYLAVALALAREKITMEKAEQILCSAKQSLRFYQEKFEEYESCCICLAERWRELKAYQFIAEGVDFATAYFSSANVVEEFGKPTLAAGVRDWQVYGRYLKDPETIGRTFVINRESDGRDALLDAAQEAVAQGSPCVILTDMEELRAEGDCEIFLCPTVAEGWIHSLAQHIPFSILVGNIRRQLGVVSFCAEIEDYRNASINGGDRIKDSRMVIR